jgi:hypothetical protein
MQVVKRWQCQTCYFKHETYEDAKQCCLPEPVVNYECGFCGKDFRENEESASNCLQGHLDEHWEQMQKEFESDLEDGQ